MLFSAYFFPRRDVVIDVAIMWVGLGIAVFGFSVDPLKEILFVGVGVSLSVTCRCVFLRERLTTAIGLLKERDTLTQLPNRAMFHRCVDAGVEAATGSDARW